MNFDLQKLSIEELRALNEAVLGMLKHKRSMEATLKKMNLKVGMIVKVNHPKLNGLELVVEEIKRTKALLRRMDGRGKYNVPISLIG